MRMRSEAPRSSPFALLRPRLHCLCSRRPPPRPLQRLKLHTSLSWGVRAWRWMSSPFALPRPSLTAKLSEEAMLDAKVAEEAILIAELAEEAIRIGKLAEMAFLIAKLAEEAILIAKLAKEAMLTLKLAEEAILIAELAEEAILIAELTSSPAAVSCKWRAAQRTCVWAIPCRSRSSMVGNSVLSPLTLLLLSVLSPMTLLMELARRTRSSRTMPRRRPWLVRRG